MCIKICAGLKFLRVLNKGIHNFGVGTSENYSLLCFLYLKENSYQERVIRKELLQITELSLRVLFRKCVESPHQYLSFIRFSQQ